MTAPEQGSIAARMLDPDGVDLAFVDVPESEEITAGSFAGLAEGDEIRLVQVTDALITAFAPMADGRPGRVCRGVVRGGPFDGTEQWQWIPSTDDEAAGMKMAVYKRSVAPPVGALRRRPADGSVWAATDVAGLYACVGSGGTSRVGMTQYRQALGGLVEAVIDG